MSEQKASGALGLIGIVVCVVLYFVGRRFFPKLSTLILIVCAVIVLLIVLLVVVVMAFAFRKPKPKPGELSGTDVTAILAKGRSNLMELRSRLMRVRNVEIRSTGEAICKTIDQILRTLKEQPEDIPSVRKFFNYYLPTLGSILTKYLRLEQSGVPAEDTTQKTIACLTDIQTAMQKQYENLFDNDVLDLTAEMEVMTQICKRDGLLADDVLQIKEGDRVIELTL